MDDGGDDLGMLIRIKNSLKYNGGSLFYELIQTTKATYYWFSHTNGVFGNQYIHNGYEDNHE